MTASKLQFVSVFYGAYLEMTRTCIVRGCDEHAPGFGRLCQAHKSRVRRRGDPRQHAVSRAHLKPCIELVEARIETHPASKASASADSRWQGHRTLPDVRFEKIAAEEVIKLSKHVEPRAVVRCT
jgi:hypothetical protein